MRCMKRVRNGGRATQAQAAQAQALQLQAPQPFLPIPETTVTPAATVTTIPMMKGMRMYTRMMTTTGTDTGWTVIMQTVWMMQWKMRTGRRKEPLTGGTENVT